MNTTGFLRGYMSKNMNSERFIEVVREALSREFEEEVKLEKIDNEFKITMRNYNITMSKELIDRIKGAYSIDRYILDEFKKQGFEFDKNRSQYIQYCYGINLRAYKKEDDNMIIDVKRIKK